MIPCARIRMIAQSTFWGILIVGQGSEDQRQALINAGADSYLPYPFDRSKIISQVRSLLDKRTPVSAYQVLPIKLAAAIDKVFLKI